MNGAARIRCSLLITALHTILSCAAIAAFIFWCVAWGKRGPSSFPYLAEYVWLLLTAGTCWLWLRELRSVLVTLVGATMCAAAWSVTMADFPPAFIERDLPLEMVIGWSPALLALIAGVLVSRGSWLAGGLMLLLGAIGAFPYSIWSTETGVIGGYAEYGYSAAALAFPVIAGGLGTGCAALGHLLRKRILP